MWNTLQIDKLKKLACLALSGGEWRVTRERKRGENGGAEAPRLFQFSPFWWTRKGGKSLRLFGHQADPNWAWLSDQQRQTKLILLIYHHQKKSKIKTNYDTFFLFFSPRETFEELHLCCAIAKRDGLLKGDHSLERFWSTALLVVVLQKIPYLTWWIRWYRRWLLVFDHRSRLTVRNNIFFNFVYLLWRQKPTLKIIFGWYI